MPTDLSAEQRTGTVRAFLKLCIASSILQSALILTVYWLHLSLLPSYLLAVVPIAPLGAALVGAVRKRAAETDPYVRRAYVGAMVIPVAMIAMIAVLIALISGIRGGLASAFSSSAMPLVLGSLFAGLLLLPKRMWDGGSLGDQLLPVRSKLVTPTLNRSLWTVAVCFVYIAVSFVSRMLFDSHALTGALAYTVAVLPVLPLFGLVPIYNRYLAEEQDEFQRHLFHQSVLVAFFGTFVFASLVGCLQDHGLISQRISGLFRYYVFYIFLWLQFEAFYVITFIQSLRIRAQEKQEKKAK